MNQEDFDRISERGVRCSELARTRGVRALDVSAAWRGNMKAATFEPHRGQKTVLWCWTHEREVRMCEEHGMDCDGDPITVNDPTGEADSSTVDQLRHARLVAAIGAWEQATATLTNLLLLTVPHAPKQNTEGPPEGACENCWLDSRYFQPVEHYKKLCRFCGDFKGSEGQVPPLRILRLRHAGRRITRQEVDRALGRNQKSA